MADKCQVESACIGGWQDSVCIHTKKICDSCIEEDITVLRNRGKKSMGL